METYSQLELVLDACPIACLIFNDHLEAIDCNRITVEVSGAGSKEELIENYQLFSPEKQPDGEDSTLKMQRYLEKAAATGTQQMEWIFRLSGGTFMPCKVTISKVKWEDSFRLYMFAEDLSELTEEMKKMQEAENRLRLMMDNNLLITTLWNHRGERIDCSIYALKVFGLEKKEDYLNHFYDLNPEYQPNGMSTVEAAEYHINKAFAEGYDKFDWMFLTAKGEELPVETTLIRVWWNNEFHLLGHSIDKRELKNTNAKLEHHAQLLRATNQIATNMMKASPHNFDEIIHQQLEQLGKAARVKRTYIWRNFEKDGKIFCGQLYEWNENAEKQQGKDSAFVFDFDDAPYTKAKILNGESINGSVRQFSDGEYKVYEMQGIQSILLLPLKLNNQVWGIIGFDDCERECEFTKEVEQLLSSCGALLLSAILRNAATLNLISTKNELLIQEKLLRAVNESAKILLEDHGKKNNESMVQALQVIGDGVDALSIGIWKNITDEPNGGLCSKRLIFWSTNEAVDVSGTVIVSQQHHVKQWDKGELILPIYLEGEAWGFACFSFQDQGRILSDKEMDNLQSANLMIASAIIREETNQRLKAKTREALESVRAKNEFLARMSHEIRTPINAVIGMTTIAKGTQDMEKIDSCLDTIMTSSQQLLVIINDVLDMSKIDLGKMTIINEAFNFEMMLSTVIEMLRERIEEKKLSFRYDFDRIQKRYIISDEKRLMQVIINLLTNAIKFTPEGGAVTLKVRWPMGTDDTQLLSIAVIDNGIGVSANALPIIFNSFEQGDGSITRKYGGTGLGLAISKNIIMLMNGTIHAESEPNKGSTFTFEVPVAWHNNIAIHNKIAALSEQLRILVIEKVPEDIRYFRQVLQEFAQDCDGVASEEEALLKVQQMQRENLPYHIAFIELDMEENSGLVIAKKIQEVSPTIKIVLLTAVSKLKIAEKRKRHDDWNYLVKPLMPIAIYRMLLSCFSEETQKEETMLQQYDWSNQTILLVEDIAINREIVKALLEDTQVNIECAENGQEAVDMFRANPAKYDFIFMDMQMPAMDGLTATRNIRELPMPEAKTVPIYAMTANAFHEDEEQCLAAGMNGYLSKPIDIAKLYEALAFEFAETSI